MFDSKAYNRQWNIDNKAAISEKKRTYYLANKDREVARVAKYREANAEAIRAYDRQRQATPERKRSTKDNQLTRMYGLPLEQFEAMRQAQGNKCASCNDAFSDKPRSRYTCCVDHCHATGQIRGLLCGNCNRGIGLMQDSPERLQRAATYLLKSMQDSKPAA